MTERQGIPFAPDGPVPPGESISEMLDERGTTQADFAQLLGRTEKNISQVINGKAPIGHDLAIDLERVLGAPAAFWNNLEATYRDLLARQREGELLAGESDWAKQFPLKQMEADGLIARESAPGAQVASLLDYFGVASTDAWREYWSSPKRLAARMTASYTPDIAALTVWLRRGELAARKVETAPYDAKAFETVVLEARALTLDHVATAVPELERRCAQAGVALVLVPEFPKIRCYGVSRWTSSDKPVIQLCLLYKSADQLWFNFFHETCHVLRHSKKRTFIDGLNTDSIEEQEADQFAADTLIPPDDWAAFASAGKPSRAEVLDFAVAQGIAAGIVVGRLQREKVIPYNWLNDLKVRLRWSEG